MLTGAQPDANGVLVLLPPVLSPAAIRISPRDEERNRELDPQEGWQVHQPASQSTRLEACVIQQARPRRTGLWLHTGAWFIYGESVSLCGIVNRFDQRPRTPMSGQEESDGIDVEGIRETDRNCRQTTMTSTGAIEANQLRTGTLTSFWRDFISQKRPTSEGRARHLGTTDHLVLLYREGGNSSIATSEASPPARTRTDPVSSNSAPAQGVPARKGRILGHVASTRHSTVNSTLSNSTQNLKSW